LFKKQFNELKLENAKVWALYDHELLERKRLHNVVEDMKGKIRVFCRVRPMNDDELKMSSLPVVTIVN
jgi:hypothetical protein